MVQSISDSKKSIVFDLYYKEKLSVKEIAEHFKVSADAATFFVRKHNIKRRTQAEARAVWFDKQKPSFTKRKLNSDSLKELAVIGAMLYWGEGYKGNDKLPAHIVDFANSDHKMILLFLRFLRSVFILDEKKFRVYLYCYSNQDISKIINFWSKITEIPKNQFTKPYVKNDFKVTANKMPYGLIHVRYSDKKLLLEIKSMIESYVKKYA